jgi:hypothetical protein
VIVAVGAVIVAAAGAIADPVVKVVVTGAMMAPPVCPTS